MTDAPAGANDDDSASAATPPVGGTPAQTGGRNLATATIVGVGLGALFLGSLFAGPTWFAFVIMATIVAGMWEAAKELEKVGLQVDAGALMLSAAAIVWLTLQNGERGQASGVALAFALAVMVQLFDKERTDVLRRMAVTVFLPVWVGLMASYAVLLRADLDGHVLALGVIGAAIFGDIGGFAVGVKFGKTKIAPSVSPKKSAEGLAGGLVLSGVLAAFVLPQASVLFTPLTALVLGVVCAFGGFLGDLVESMVKRDMGIKDFGDLIPGHGGVLDRVDGILVALPIGWFVTRLLVF